MPTASHPSGRTLRRPGTSVAALALGASARAHVRDEPVPGEVRSHVLPAEVSLP